MRPGAGSTSTIRSWLSVSVPVLSVAITVASPIVSIAERLRTIAPRRAISRAPWASAIVTTAGKPLGNGSDRDGDADEKRLVERGALREHPERQYDGQPDAEQRQLRGEIAELALKRGGRRLRGRDERSPRDPSRSQGRWPRRPPFRARA